MKTLPLVAIAIAKEGQRDFLKEEILKLIPITREEKGCIKYVLFEDNKDNLRFVLEEDWASYDEWQAHMNNDHMANFLEVAKDAIESLEVIELTQVD